MAATDYDFILTRDELIDSAYRKCGVLADGENLTAEQLDTGVKLLNGILDEWEGDGFLLISHLKDSLVTVAGTASYAKPTDNGLDYVAKVTVLIDGQEYPVDRLSIDDYDDLRNKADPGQPINFAHNVREDKIYFYPVPDEIWTMNLYGHGKLKDWETSEGTGELSARWQRAMRYALAVELAENNTLPQKQLDTLERKANGAYLRARGKEVDKSERRGVRGYY